MSKPLRLSRPFFIAGPCVVESEALCLRIARELARVSARIGADVVFKASFDKANRTSVKSFRGPGAEKGLAVLRKVKAETGLKVLTDIHEPSQAARASRVADILQIPAFLCRQTDLILAAADTGKCVNVKKGQFLAPEDAVHIIEKIKSRGNRQVMITERGSAFGYHDLVVDMRSLVVLRSLKVPVVFDATHSVQRPGAGKGLSGGDRRMVAPLARAAAAVGVDGFFMEVHPTPDKARSDAANSLALSGFEKLAQRLIRIHEVSSDHL